MEKTPSPKSRGRKRKADDEPDEGVDSPQTTTTTTTSSPKQNANSPQLPPNAAQPPPRVDLNPKDKSYVLNPPPGPDTSKPVVRVYADGVYDLLHYGHARSLKQAKELFPNTYLIVGVTSDEDTHKLKGKTLCDENERAEMVMHCRYVDQVVARCPWVITEEFINLHKIDYVVHGEDFSADANGEDAYALVKKLGKFKALKRTEGVSTSDLIMRILKNYNDYVKRNLKRGYSRKDMNVSYLKEQQLKLQDAVDNLGKNAKAGIDHLFDGADHILTDFLKLFGKDKDWEEFKRKVKRRKTGEEGSDGSSSGSESGDEAMTDEPSSQ